MAASGEGLWAWNPPRGSDDIPTEDNILQIPGVSMAVEPGLIILRTNI